VFKTTSLLAAEAVARHCGGRACAVVRMTVDLQITDDPHDGEFVEVDDSIPAQAYAIKVQGEFIDMTQAIWSRLSQQARELAVDPSGLTKQLIGLEGWRVQVTDHDGEVRRFQVGKSTGWRPCHLELVNRRSAGGDPALPGYRRVTPLYLVR